MIFATNNENKLRELKKILNIDNIKSLKDIGLDIDIPESGKTFYENALIKAKTIYEITKIPTIADDSGLILCELGNWPGVYTKRIEIDAKKHNMTRNEYLIQKGKELKDKRIKAVCDLVYYDGKEIIKAEGVMHGTITKVEYPGNGFGFDSIFELSDGRIVSQLSEDEKNKISHRYHACQKLKKLLKNHYF